MLTNLVITLCLALILRGSEGADTCDTVACQKTAHRILEYMDSKVPPCQNFYRFACGNFLQTAVIPDSGTRNSAFTEVNLGLKNQLHQILLRPKRSDEPKPYRNVKHLFNLCVDEKKMDARGVSHAVSLLKSAGGWPVLGNWNKESWNFLEMEIQLRNLGLQGGNFFTLFVSPDENNSSRRVIKIDQASLGLGRMYLVNGENYPTVKDYYSYMVDIAVMFGASKRTATQQLLESLRFEIALAQITTPIEQRRDYHRMYNPYLLPDLMKDPQLGWIDWKRLLSSIMPQSVPLMDEELIIVKEVDYIKNLQHLIENYPAEVLANYRMWQVASGLTDILTSKMRERQFQYSNVESGRKSKVPRWRTCLLAVTSPALSSLYVKEFFNETSKTAALEIVEAIRQEMISTIKEVDWMDDETRKRAEFKASKMAQYVGYPDELLDMTKLEDFYKDLTINEKHYFEAVLHGRRWVTEYHFLELRKPVEKDDWRKRSVTEINASYDFMTNSIRFPAGILQPPWFSSQVPRYVNYATIGVVMGHETTHGFDYLGSQFDADGEMNEWREDETIVRFEEKVKCIIDQYSSYRDNETKLNINGVNTQDENVADNGGMKLAFRAYHRLADKLSMPEPLLPGLETYSLDQLFFLSHANSLCTKYRTQELKSSIIEDTHAPEEFRVNGVLKNLPEFSQAFQCKGGDPMNPELKCSVW